MNADSNNIETALYALAHARAGDKGERLSVCVFAYHEAAYPLLCQQVTEMRVNELFAHRGTTRVRRYLLPRLNGMNFVLDGALEGGVNGSLNLDGHGKSQSFRLLELPITVPAELAFALHD
ncbi:hypothetical protein DSM110093_03757 (plasmid) [Sulfitobacter sp. DSM 110093]|uniref:AtuA-related protein n=1 Tax=Sulfitobacter sp. DSM 110093 TaxID=2883127 RepID=UPI001FACFA74|nr:hypothetical protein [Sulfitobacter sp. DSM 110093]UOA33661.1 hypothetical protein DSM110093_03496 [Sulfitobacter sp. DSM 110093]UOA33922.1 hypothetical protein DSM110093_03757 [Sulfitobacter sp. DSM 110093]